MKKNQLYTAVAVVAGLAVVSFFFLFNGSSFLNQSLPQTQSMTTDTSGAGLVAQDQEVGTGAVAQVGQEITLNYTGKLQNGTVFDTSVGRAPFTFVLGAGRVIAGWEQGIQGMKVGGKRLLIIPPALGYGASGMGPIPPNATLVFEVELLKVGPAGTSTAGVVPEGANAE